MKRQFMMLAHTIEDPVTLDNRDLCGHYVSEKFDGLRMYWDGGISRGIPVKEVPYANIEKDDRLIDPNYLATGLWSRNAKVIRAPEWFLDILPRIPLDGEVWGGRGNWEVTSSIVKQLNPSDDNWRKIEYQIFDSPPFDVIFADGVIDTEIYHKDFTVLTRDWVNAQAKIRSVKEAPYRHFEYVLKWLKQQINGNHLSVALQTSLPYHTEQCKVIINQMMAQTIANKGEGLMIRNHNSYWSPERSHSLLKLKPWYDAEAVVIGYTWGRETKKGSRLLGRMGALVVTWNGKEFELSGFKDMERCIDHTVTGQSAYDVGRTMPGKPVPDYCWNPIFPRGTVVTFRYRELTAAGIPKSGTYLRTIS